VLLTGGSAERDLAEEVRRAAGLPPDSVLAGRTDLEQLAAVVAGARLLVSGDTGVAHLATAYRTPSVVLFGPVSPARWGPPATGPHVALWRGRGEGDPWGERIDTALAAISVEEVVSVARQLLAQHCPDRRSTSPASA
jgi:ADP-heptose:LPS heptosyltransferase